MSASIWTAWGATVPSPAGRTSAPFFQTLGDLEVRHGGRSLDVTARLRRTILAVLLTEAGRTVPLDTLIGCVWADTPPPSAIATLQSYVANLRQVLEPGRRTHAPATVLVTRGTGYALEVDRDQVDGLLFEDLVARALGRRDPLRAAADLSAAFELWRGEPLAEFGEPWALAYRNRLAEIREAAAEERVEGWLAAGSAAAAVVELEAMVVRRPLRERRWGQLIRALYACGRQAEALAAYRRCRALLNAEFGLEPGPELRRLESAVLAHDSALIAPIDAPRARHAADRSGIARCPLSRPRAAPGIVR
ncbi:winged helix-turn-helix domain-containing protein [Streptosporangiaceae bacterium NEAU-GS5]|nr:winged helix-turn-helix domain-containing protein [Streptosporangiaceae bacterium NEAU-GS5]